MTTGVWCGKLSNEAPGTGNCVKTPFSYGSGRCRGSAAALRIRKDPSRWTIPATKVLQ